MELEILKTVVSTGNPVVIGLGIIGILSIAIFKYKTREKPVVVDALRAIEGIYQTLNTVLSSTPVSAARLMVITDSGKIPRAGIPMFATSVHEVCHEPNTTSKNIWNRLPLDEYLNSYAIQLEDSKEPIILQRDQLKSGSLLRDVMTTCKSEQLMLVHILQGESMYHYLQLEFPTEYVLTPEDRNLIRISTNTIRKILKGA